MEITKFLAARAIASDGDNHCVMRVRALVGEPETVGAKEARIEAYRGCDLLDR